MSEKDQLLFIYSSILSIQFHPGVKERMTPKEVSAAAYYYYCEYKRLEGCLWEHGSARPLGPEPV